MFFLSHKTISYGAGNSKLLKTEIGWISDFGRTPSWRRTRYKMIGWRNREDDTTSGNPLRGRRQTYVCVHTHTSGVSNILSAGTSDDFCCSLTAPFHKEQKKKYRLVSNYRQWQYCTAVSYVIPGTGMCYTYSAPIALLGNVASPKTICCTSSCSVSSSSSLAGGRPTSSLLIQSLPAARRVFVWLGVHFLE